MSIYIDDLVPEGAESGVGLALQDSLGRYLFFLAGTKFACPPGELFYAGIGGHREEGETWTECAHREAIEEMGVDVELLPSDDTWIVSSNGEAKRTVLSDELRPMALYRMVHPEGTPRAGETYHIVIYRAALLEPPSDLPIDEVRGIIALSPEQVIQSSQRKPSIAKLISEGAEIVTLAKPVDMDTLIYPIGTASALATVLCQATREYPLPTTDNRISKS